MNIITDNLTKVIEFINTIPEEKVYLDAYASDCGSCFCLAGWLCQNKYFAEQGLHLSGSSSNPLGETLDKLFGEFSFSNLFLEFGHGLTDDKLMSVQESEHDETELLGNLSHKELAIARLEYQLKSVKGIV